MHEIILGSFSVKATVCAYQPMKFKDVSPQFVPIRSDGTAPFDCGLPILQPQGRQSRDVAPKAARNALYEIAGRFAIEQLRLPGAERHCSFEPLDREFPFRIEMHVFANGYSWTLRQRGQDGLALIVPLDGLLRFDAGERPNQLDRGEILVARDPNIAVSAETEKAEVQTLVISFLPCFVYSLGSPSRDQLFLLPLYGLQPPVVRVGPSSGEIHRAIARLARCYLDRSSYFEVGCKALFLELLYYIAREFRDAESIRSEMIRQKERTERLSSILEYVERNYAERITLKEAASLAKMSVPQFVRIFKKVAGMSFVSYLTHVRLSRSVRLLKESCHTIAEVAYQVGFSDQSYFDRRFKAAFGQTPRDFRSCDKNLTGSRKGERDRLSDSVRATSLVGR